MSETQSRLPEAAPATPPPPLPPPVPPPALPPPPTRGVPVVAKLAAFALAALAVYGISTHWKVWSGAAGPQTTDDAYLQSDLTPITARVPGYVSRVLVGDFQRVRQGDTLVEIVDSDYRAQLAQATANVAAAEAAIAIIAGQRGLQEANVRAAGAAIEATAATLQRYLLEEARQRSLLATGIAGTRQLVEQSEANERQTTALLDQNRAQRDAAQAQLQVLDAQAKQAQATLAAQQAARDLAQINLGYTRLTAPTDGMVGQRGVRAGQYLSAGAQAIMLVGLPNVWVIANYKETQLEHLQIGQPATVRVDTFPGIVLKGRVDSYAPASGSQFSLLPADNATGNFTKVVQRIPVKIAITDPAALADKLRPGMSVVATIDTAATPAKP